MAEYEKEGVKEVEQPTKSQPQPVERVVPLPPYPQRLKNKKLDQQFGKFLEVFKKLHININFAQALEHMPSYVKFMKDILSKKRRLGDYETDALTEECSAILQKKLPPKLKDPSSFNIPVTIGDKFTVHALCDQGTSINLMSLSIYNMLRLGEPKPTSVTLQLADRTLSYPKGVVEDVLVKVEKFIFPADFIVLDYEADKDVPIILGRSFLATGRTLIDVQKGELTMRVQNKEVTFNVFKAMRAPNDNLDECFRIDTINCSTEVEFFNSHTEDTLEATLLAEANRNDEEFRECVSIPDSIPHFSKFVTTYEALDMPDKSKVRTKTSIEEPPQLKLKPLLEHLKYANLGENNTLLVIISASLSVVQEEKLLRVLKESKKTIGWSITNIKGISPSFCMHKIFLEEGHKPSMEH